MQYNYCVVRKHLISYFMGRCADIPRYNTPNNLSNEKTLQFVLQMKKKDFHSQDPIATLSML